MAKDAKGRGSDAIADKPREYVIRVTEDEKALIEQVRRDAGHVKTTK
jgi:hypothetical protein